MLYEDLFLKNYNIKIIKYTNLELEKKISQIKKKYKILKFVKYRYCCKSS